jgi:hypothetical protein
MKQSRGQFSGRDGMLDVADLNFWQAVKSGGDIAIYAILYYVHSINNRVITLEIKYNELKGWVNRLDNRVENALGNVKKEDLNNVIHCKKDEKARKQS